MAPPVPNSRGAREVVQCAHGGNGVAVALSLWCCGVLSSSVSRCEVFSELQDAPEKSAQVETPSSRSALAVAVAPT